MFNNIISKNSTTIYTLLEMVGTTPLSDFLGWTMILSTTLLIILLEWRHLPFRDINQEKNYRKCSSHGFCI